MKMLFICKQNENYGGYAYGLGKRSGLYNSTRFVSEALSSNGVEAKTVIVVDNNAIDKEVSSFKPDIVVIEALWVVPSKFDVLKKLYPKIKWYIHLHSNVPFLAIEGVAIEWIKGYFDRGVGVICNASQAANAVSILSPSPSLVSYLPNIYTGVYVAPSFSDKSTVNIGCFGAIRPMKNQLLQAMAAIRFAKEIGKDLKFYINSGRSETGGDPVLKNLKALLGDSLVECPWYEHADFLVALKDIDIGMQVSMSETFNIVSADYVVSGLPIVVSNEVSWASSDCWARADSIDSIVYTLHNAYQSTDNVAANQTMLQRYSDSATAAWLSFINNQ